MSKVIQGDDNDIDLSIREMERKFETSRVRRLKRGLAISVKDVESFEKRFAKHMGK